MFHYTIKSIALQEVNNKLGALRKAIDMAEHASTQTK